MLTGDTTKYLGIIFGVTFASLLIAQQMSIFCGIMMLTTSQIRDVEGVDLWVMDRDVLSIDDYKPMPDTALYRVRSVPGVLWAVPFYKGVARARLTMDPIKASQHRGKTDTSDYDSVLGIRFPEKKSGNGATELTIYQQVMLLGVDDATLVGAPQPEHMLFGSLNDLRKPDAILIDKYSCQLLWKDEKDQLKTLDDYRRFLGRTIEMNDRRAVVVGICTASPNFQTLPIVYTTYSRAKQYVPPERKLMPFILVKAEPDVAVPELSASIAEHTANLLKARTPDQFFWDTIWYYIRYTGIPMNFMMTVGLGFIVGTAIAGQTFYQFTLENLKQFGALKAMGTSNGRILSMILLQAMVVGPIGYSLGVGLAAGFGHVTRDDPSMAFYMPWQVLLITGVAVLLICLLSSLLSIRRVLVLEPAIVFRA
jgi:putative ABC transport system permease protein